MRNNQPTTLVEYTLRDVETVVSKTDLDGNITYVNRDFLNVSGFPRAELLGASHNLVRHPSMPREVFADLWHTLQQGKSWTGMLKNRCKNGDFYWVETNIAPLLENGKTIGYTAIAIKPSREQIELAECAYESMRNGECRMEIVAGKIQRPSFLRKIRALENIPFKYKVAMLLGGFALLFALQALYAWNARQAFIGFGGALPLLGVVGCGLSYLVIRKSLIQPLNKANTKLQEAGLLDLSCPNATGCNIELKAVLEALRTLHGNVALMNQQLHEAHQHVLLADAKVAAADRSRREESIGMYTGMNKEQIMSSVENVTQFMHSITSPDAGRASNINAMKGAVQQHGNSHQQAALAREQLEDSSGAFMQEANNLRKMIETFRMSSRHGHLAPVNKSQAFRLPPMFPVNGDTTDHAADSGRKQAITCRRDPLTGLLIISLH